jgi:hypothetical protein
MIDTTADPLDMRSMARTLDTLAATIEGIEETIPQVQPFMKAQHQMANRSFPQVDDLTRLDLMRCGADVDHKVAEYNYYLELTKSLCSQISECFQGAEVLERENAQYKSDLKGLLSRGSPFGPDPFRQQGANQKTEDQTDPANDMWINDVSRSECYRVLAQVQDILIGAQESLPSSSSVSRTSSQEDSARMGAEQNDDTPASSSTQIWAISPHLWASAAPAWDSQWPSTALDAISDSNDQEDDDTLGDDASNAPTQENQEVRPKAKARRKNINGSERQRRRKVRAREAQARQEMAASIAAPRMLHRTQ